MQTTKKTWLYSVIILLGLGLPVGVSAQMDNLPDKADQDLFLDSLARSTFNFFWELGNTDNGQIPDRWPNEMFTSIAATGFGLTSYIIGVERGYVTREEAAKRVVKTLRFLFSLPKGPEKSGIAGYKGFFYHFLYQKTGLRYENVELSTIDTTLLLAGVLACMTYFDQENNATEKDIRVIARDLYLSVEWDWAMDGRDVMSMGWFPDKGFLDASWKGYNEAMILYIMALGSPTHPIQDSTWKAWTNTYEWKEHLGYEYVNFGPLFGHQYSQCYIDFKGIQDAYMRQKGIDYFENSKRATYANRRYCYLNPGAFTGYSDQIWGLTACDGPGNEKNRDPNIHFMGYGARGVGYGYLSDDGTIAPTAAGGSIAFAPEICVPALMQMKYRYPVVYGKYGFFDSFNLTYPNKNGTTGWVDPDYLGIDQGPILIQIDNYQSGTILNLMKKNPYIVRGLKKAGFTGGWLTK